MHHIKSVSGVWYKDFIVPTWYCITTCITSCYYQTCQPFHIPYRSLAKTSKHAWTSYRSKMHNDLLCNITTPPISVSQKKKILKTRIFLVLKIKKKNQHHTRLFNINNYLIWSLQPYFPYLWILYNSSNSTFSAKIGLV